MLSQLKPITTAIASYAHELAWPEVTPGDVRTLTVFAVFLALFALEARGAYRKSAGADVRQSHFTNLGTLILNDTLMSLLAVSSLWLVAERYSDYGVLSGIADPVTKGVCSLLLLDLALYGWHRLTHTVDALWMLHKVHHSDRCMNVTTAFRLHGGEMVLTTLVKAAFIVLVGVDSALLMVNEAVITLFVMFHHTNIAFPGERWLGRLIVVPYLHRAHHSIQRSEHDRNYGALLSVWDRLFGTLIEQEPVVLGLRGVAEQNPFGLVAFGLTRTSPPQPETLRAMIAEAAYFRAERRGFAPGDELVDWLEAEQDILAAAGMLRSAHRTLGWVTMAAGWLASVQNSVRTRLSSFHSRVRTEGAVLRNAPKAIWACVAKRFRPVGTAGPRSKRRLPALRLIRLCVQD